MIKRKTFQKEQIAEMLQPFSKYMSAEQIEMLPTTCPVYEYGRDTYIYREGDVADNVFCIIHGAAKLYMGDIGLQQQIMALYKTGEYLGIDSMCSQENHRSSCLAMTGAIVCHIPISFIQPIIYSHPDLMRYVLKRLSFQLIMSRLRYIRLTQKHMRGRLADVLLQLVNWFGYESDGSTISIELSREELASISNMTTANAIRTLSAFADEKVITLNRRQIRIIDIKALLHISRHD